MENELNIAAILKDKPQGTKLYDWLHNIDVELDTISTTDTETVVWCTNETNEAGINWFLDNLWHGFDEVPRNDYSQVVLIRGNNQALPTILDMNDLMDNSEVEGDYEVPLEGYCKNSSNQKVVLH